MTILTIESVCVEPERELRKLLSTKRGIVPSEAVTRHDDSSAIFHAISSFATVVKHDANAYVLPISLTRLSRSEYAGIALELIKFLKFQEHPQIVVCVDGDPNSALAEMFEHDHAFATLDELRELRHDIMNNDAGKTIGRDVRFVKTTPKTLYAVDVI
jgi:hypothetical protein